MIHYKIINHRKAISIQLIVTTKNRGILAIIGMWRVITALGKDLPNSKTPNKINCHPMQPEFLPTLHVIQFKLNEPNIIYSLNRVKAITGEG
jgi:hypothetical protein